jgi:hypothetical protein
MSQMMLINVRRHNKRLINQSGMSLVSVLFGISISLAVATIIAESITQIKKMEVLADLSVETQSWLRSVELALLDSQSCALTLQKTGQYPIDPAKLKNKPGIPLNAIWQGIPPNPTGSNPTNPTGNKVLFKTGNGLWESNPQSRLLLNKIYLSADSNQVFPASGVAPIKINFEIKKKIGNGLGGDYLMRSLILQVTTDGDKNIIACTAVDDARVVELTSNICFSLGGNFDKQNAKCDLKNSTHLLEFVCKSWGLGSDSTTQKCVF